jgi:hypothetical protein
MRDAGFPQGGGGTWTYPPAAIVARSAERVYAPTLAELIEACGLRFHALRQDAGVYCWVATGAGQSENGRTPAEAVARLWLALNKS